LFFHFWILAKYIKAWRQFFDVTILLTVAGITLGVSVLMVAMSSFSGFETTLKRAIIEAVGDVAIYKRNGKIDKIEALEKQLKPYRKAVQEQLYFLGQESLVASKGKISAIFLQGVEKEKTASVLNLKNRITQGQNSWDYQDDVPPAYLGKDLLKKMNLKIGDSFKIVIPRTNQSASTSDLNPIIKTFYVVAAVDLGKYDFNSRFIFVDLPILQELLGTQNISGVRLKLKNSDRAEKWAQMVQEKLGWSYSVMDWRQTNKNYFSAIDYEKRVIFFVVLIIVVAAGFNVITSLFVTILKRYRDISLLKTLGATPFDIGFLFCLHGLLLGAIGTGLGLIIGWSLCFGFEWMQKVFPLLPPDIYRLSFVATEFRAQDLLWICGATMTICFLSTLIPALRGAQLSPVEGLKYE
jgi:lipoprotein-releasing system permease protein